MEHHVAFDEFCPKCVNRDKDENEKPCDDCMDISAREDSKRPIHFTERRGTDDGRETERKEQ